MLIWVFGLAFLPLVWCQNPINVTFSYQGTTTTVRGLDNLFKGHSFFGIPYASPPIGDLRFKPAQPLMKLPAFVDATREKAECAQHSSGSTEDCLYLNVFTPETVTAQSNLPVYVFIHGGSFVGGNPHVPIGVFDNLINRGPIVAVSIFYRLGPFGFFSTRDSAVPGNAAISDWIAALQWVQTYIRFFGGDPTKVTIGGQSAGAIAVSTLTYTRKADNLFRAAIMESGSAFLPTFMSYSDDTRNSSMITAVAAGCATEDQWKKHDPAENQKIVTCLRGKTWQDIIAADTKAPSYDTVKWGMVPEPDYLPDRLETLALQRRPINVLHGVNNLEWLSWVADWIRANNMTGFTRQHVTEHLHGHYFMSYWDNKEAVYNEAVRVYIDSAITADTDNIGWCQNHMHMWTELVFSGPSLRDARYLAFTGSKVYFYELEVAPEVEDLLILDGRLRGVAHSFELPFVYDFNPADENGQLVIGDDATMKDIMGKLWANFIVTGNPTPPTGGISMPFTWDPLSATNNYLAISQTPRMGQGFAPKANVWVCTAPSIDGRAPPFCN